MPLLPCRGRYAVYLISTSNHIHETKRAAWSSGGTCSSADTRSSIVVNLSGLSKAPVNRGQPHGPTLMAQFRTELVRSKFIPNLGARLFLLLIRCAKGLPKGRVTITHHVSAAVSLAPDMVWLAWPESRRPSAAYRLADCGMCSLLWDLPA